MSISPAALPLLVAHGQAVALQVIEPLRRRVKGRESFGELRRARRSQPAPDFHIDAVLTWVDDTDPTWLAQRAAVAVAGESFEQSAGDPVRDADSAARYHSLDELRYTLRAIDTFAPWMRRVFLVTSGHVPDWIDQRSVILVPHRDILASDALPTFNSQAIESGLHRIEGLAEHYIYFNDDVILTRPALPVDFFTTNGLPRVFVSVMPLAPGPAVGTDSTATIAAKNARDLLTARYGGTVPKLIAHSPHPQRREFQEELAAAFPDELAATEHSTIRSATDVPPIGMHQWFAVLAKGAPVTPAAYRYIELSRANGIRSLRVQAQRTDLDFICVNLAGDPHASWQQLSEAVRSTLTIRFPRPSRFELT